MKKPNKKHKTSNKKDINWKNSKSVRFALIIILLISIGVLFGAVGYTVYKWNGYSKYQSKIISVHYVNTSVQIVSSGIGMNGDTDSLKFGKVTSGSGGERALHLNSTQKAVVNVTITGDMARFLSVDKNEFIIQPNMPDKVLFRLEIPEDTIIGNYTGVIQVLFLKP